MEALYAIPFHVLEVPNLKLKKPGWVKAPSAMVVFAFVLLSYFLVTGGKYISFFIALPRSLSVWAYYVYGEKYKFRQL